MSFETELEYVEINISRILTKIIGLKTKNFNIKQSNDKLIINLDLSKFDYLEGCDIRLIIESVIDNISMFKLCHEGVNCRDNDFKVLMEYRYTG